MRETHGIRANLKKMHGHISRDVIILSSLSFQLTHLMKFASELLSCSL